VDVIVISCDPRYDLALPLSKKIRGEGYTGPLIYITDDSNKDSINPLESLAGGEKYVI
jgi:hypothetical protein